MAGPPFAGAANKLHSISNVEHEGTFNGREEWREADGGKGGYGGNDCEEEGFEFGQELAAGDGKRRVGGWDLTRRCRIWKAKVGRESFPKPGNEVVETAVGKRGSGGGWAAECDEG